MSFIVILRCTKIEKKSKKEIKQRKQKTDFILNHSLVFKDEYNYEPIANKYICLDINIFLIEIYTVDKKA